MNIKEVSVKGVYMLKTFNGSIPAVLLEDDNGMLMPIHIGQPEAISINSVLKKKTTPRPMTHDLMVSILSRLDADIESVLIDEKIDDVYYARFRVKSGSNVMEFDARPSDCIALALRENAPIQIKEKVLNNAAISKEELQGAKVLDSVF